jgi:hypothetical protein
VSALPHHARLHISPFHKFWNSVAGTACITACTQAAASRYDHDQQVCCLGILSAYHMACHMALRHITRWRSTTLVAKPLHIAAVIDDSHIMVQHNAGCQTRMLSHGRPAAVAPSIAYHAMLDSWHTNMHRTTAQTYMHTSTATFFTCDSHNTTSSEAYVWLYDRACQSQIKLKSGLVRHHCMQRMASQWRCSYVAPANSVMQCTAVKSGAVQCVCTNMRVCAARQ